MLIRTARHDDATAIREIYGQFVLGSPATFDLEVPSVEELKRWIDERQCEYPFLVAESDEQVAGYAYASRQGERAAYRWSVQVTVYIDPGFHRQGVGRGLYEALLAQLRSQQFRMAYAGITLPNEASVALHEAMGFRRVATYNKVGYKMGAWRDVGWWELDLHPEWQADPPPGEPRPCDAG